jgi:2'-5' RNA ligase
MEKESLYFVAIIPPQEICDEITAFKQDFAQHYNSHKALKVIPHITLKTPFKLMSDAHSAIVAWFKNLAINIAPFKVELKNFDAFHNKHNPVVFVHPEMTKALATLQKEMLKSFLDYFPFVQIPDVEFKFKPHITVAYRDLEPEQFFKAWPVYKEKKYHAEFVVNDFHLMQHDGRKWNIVQTYKFNG